MSGTGSWGVRAAGPGDAARWVDTHLTALAETYPDLPAGFVGSRRRRRHQLTERAAADIVGAGPGERYQLAVDADETVLGIGHSCPGTQDWERRLLTRYPDAEALGLRRPAGLLQLSTLYTVTAVHGRGVGAALFDALVGERACYLWIMTGNPRAEAFYRRRGFVRVSANVPSGPTWCGWPMFQMARTRTPGPPRSASR